jgi:hypothetical protein
VTGNTALVGSMVNSQTGDMRFKTGSLTAVDLVNNDELHVLGGGFQVGFGKSGFTGSVSLDIQDKDKEGITRATIGAGTITIGSGMTPDKARDLLAVLNRDPAKFVEITKDQNDVLKADLDIGALVKLPQNIANIGYLLTTLATPVPDDIAAQGSEAVKLFKTALLNGMTEAEIKEYIESEDFNAHLKQRQLVIDLQKANANPEITAMALFMSLKGEKAYYDEDSGTMKLAGDCSQSSFAKPCGLPLDELAKKAKDDPAAFSVEANKIINAALEDAMLKIPMGLLQNANEHQKVAFSNKLDEAIACAIAWSSLTGDSSTLQTVIGVMETGFLRENAGLLRSQLQMTERAIKDNGNKPLELWQIANILGTAESVSAQVYGNLLWNNPAFLAGAVASLLKNIFKGLIKTPEFSLLTGELEKKRVSFYKDEVIDIFKDANGKIIWLETGTLSAGFTHILNRHGDDFINKGFKLEEISVVIMDILKSGAPSVGTVAGSPAYKITHEGIEKFISIGVSTNGYVVRAGAHSADKIKFFEVP